jgi:hypothetical protein
MRSSVRRKENRCQISRGKIAETPGQLLDEWQHLRRKPGKRGLARLRKLAFENLPSHVCFSKPRPAKCESEKK